MQIRLGDGTVAEIEAVDLPDKFNDKLQSWDCAFKNHDDSDFVAGGCIGLKGADKFWMTEFCDTLRQQVAI